MHKAINSILVSSLLATIALTVPKTLAADAKAPTTEAPAKKKKKSAQHSVAGKISAVDKTAMTITIDGKQKKQVIHITSQTRMMKAGKPATLDDATVGDELVGEVKGAPGSEDAVSLRFGPKAKGQPAKKKAAPEAQPKKPLS